MTDEECDEFAKKAAQAVKLLKAARHWLQELAFEPCMEHGCANCECYSHSARRLLEALNRENL